MTRKSTIEEIAEIYKKFGLILLENKSYGVNHRYKCADEEGYLYSRSLQALKKSARRNNYNVGHRFSTENEFFYENMLLYIKKECNNGTCLLTEKKDIKNIDQPLKFKCGLCGKEYSLPWHTFTAKENKVCNYCFNRMRSKGETDNRHIDTNKFHLEACKRGLAILSGPDIRYHDKIVVQDSEGYRGITSPDVIMRGSKFERFAKRNPYSIDNMRIFAMRNGWDCVIYEQEYKGDKSPVKMMCSCGNDFMVDTTHFVNGKYKCNECRVKQSAIAAKVELWLNQNNISYIKEKVFDDCVNKRTLPFDFYLEDYNACIEVDGLGHYRPVGYGGKENAKKNYESRVRNDAIKTAYCESNSIPLLRLPFWVLEKDEHNEKLKEFILSIEPNELNK